jgi:hypothetical protein
MGGKFMDSSLRGNDKNRIRSEYDTCGDYRGRGIYRRGIN